MTNPTSFARRRLVDEVIDHLRSEISTGRFSSGSRLPPEAKLTAQLGVSRTTLREAIVVLSHDGLVDVRQGDGTYVRSATAPEISLTDRPVAELLEAQRPLLVGLVRLAAARRTEAEVSDLDRLTTALAGAIDAGDDKGIRPLAAAIESAIAAAAHSNVLAAFARQVSSSLDTIDAAASDHGEPLSESARYLARCVRGIIDRDPESAERHLRVWLAARASAMAPEGTRTVYGAPEIRRGPRTSHARRTDTPGAS